MRLPNSYHISNYDEMMSKLEEHQSKMILGIIKAKRYSYFETNPGGIVVEFAEE
jgi:hypothetical protein